MIRIGIVEDERLLLEDLVNHVDWDAWDIEVAFAERNGAQVLRRMSREYVDIILTDIRMPVMDGITMSEQIQKRYPHVQFIFLTSYDDVSFTKSAIQLNAVAYLSKPVNMNELHSAVQEAGRRLEMISSAEYGARLFREEQLIRLVGGMGDDEAVDTFPGSWQVFCVQIVNFLSIYHTRSAAEVKWLTTEIKNRLMYFLSCRCENFCAVYLSKGEYIVAADGIYDFSEMTGEDEQELADSVGTNVSFHFYFMHGNPLIGAEQFRDRYHDLTQLKEDGFYQYSHADSLEKSGKTIQECTRFLMKHIDDESFSDALEHWFSSVRQLRPGRRGVVSECYSICEALLNRMPYLSGSTEFSGYDRHDMLHMLEELQDLDALEQYILSLKQNLHAAQNDPGDGQDTVRQIIQHINQHYPEAISAETLTKDFYLASNTIRALFKQKTGKTIHEYLTEVRLEKARQLLADPELRIKEIAVRTGYRNVSYFCKVFADIYGVSPMSYRLQLPGRNGVHYASEE